MNSDQKFSPMTHPSRQGEKSHRGNSKILEFPITNNVSKSSHDKVENSEMNESEKEVKQTSCSAVLKGESYGLQLFDMIQNSIFKSKSLL